MVPAPLSLAERFRDALARLGAGSSRTSAFPQLALAAWANGTGALPGKAVGAVSKDCHEDYEVDSGTCRHGGCTGGGPGGRKSAPCAPRTAGRSGASVPLP